MSSVKCKPFCFGLNVLKSRKTYDHNPANINLQTEWMALTTIAQVFRSGPKAHRHCISISGVTGFKQVLPNKDSIIPT